MTETCGTCGDTVPYTDEETMPPRDEDNQALCDTCYAQRDEADRVRDHLDQISRYLNEVAHQISPVPRDRREWYRLHDCLCGAADDLINIAAYARMQAES